MAPTLVSLEEYLHTTYRPDVEYVDGVLVERNVGTQTHGSLQAIVGAFFVQLQKTHGIRSFTATRLRVTSKPVRYRVPDVMVVERPYTKGRAVVDVPAVVVRFFHPRTPWPR